jgi:DNA-binding CsgD family transcriptional regulator
MPSPVFVVDGHSRLQHFNAAAGRLLEARDGLFVRQQRLVASRPAVTAQLRASLARALTYADAASRAPSSNAKAPATVIEIPRASRRPLGLVVHPLRPPNVMRTRGHDGARAIVVVHDPDARPRVDPTLIARVHALTPTEAELAAALAEGNSLTEFAAGRGCTEATARTHLKRVLEKTGTRRQAELVHRLLASAALHLLRP